MPARSWRIHTGILALYIALTGLVGWALGIPFSLLGFAFVAYAAWQLYNVWRLYRWVQDPAREIPESYGVWADLYHGINRIETKNRKQKKKYRAMISDFTSLTDAFPDATLVIDRNDTITWFNSAAVRLLGLKSPQDLGSPITNLLRGPDFANWLAVEGEVQSPLEMPSPRGEGRWLTISAVSFRKDQRLIVLRDTTEVHNVDLIRRDFVANISHELRTPLTVLQGYLEMLDDHPSDEVSDAVQRMLGQTGQMQSLLDDLLELSRVQNSELKGEEEVVNIPAMLMQLKEQALELSKNKHDLVFDITPGLSLSGVAIDLESAFSNLISNAIKYTPKGGEITVTWQSTLDGPELAVSDTGIGIPRRDIPRLTERFYRVGSDRARKTGGSGLGLAIVKHVLNAHQADLMIESELGAGSKFICSFPPERAISEQADR
jgi:two-component system phosphate regulon sensor histidine kinase PhoR